MLGRVLRVIVNSLAFVVLLMMAVSVWYGNPLLAIVLFLAAIDQFEDVYYYTTGKRMFPDWFRPIDVSLELVLIAVGVGILLFSVVYYLYFETWFFRMLMIMAVLMVYSAAEDIVQWRSGEQMLPTSTPPLSLIASVVGGRYVRSKKEVRAKAFVRKK